MTGRSRGYAFVEFTSSTSALMAYKRGNKTIIDGSEVFVDMECERLLPGWVPRRLGKCYFCFKKARHWCPEPFQCTAGVWLSRFIQRCPHQAAHCKRPLEIDYKRVVNWIWNTNHNVLSPAHYHSATPN